MSIDRAASDQLEHDVASLYRQMGYTVREQVEVCGKNVDVVAELEHPGSGHHRTYVEVKYTGNKSLHVKEVRDWAADVDMFRHSGDYSSAVMVTNADYTPQGHSTAAAKKITLLTVRALEEMALGVDAPLRRSAEEYQTNVIYRHYIDLDAALTTSPPDVAGLPESVPTSALRQLALDHPDVGFLLFADFGAGKTTALARIHRDAVVDRATKGFGPIPLMFELKHFEVGHTLDSFVASTWKESFGRDIPIDLFWDLVEDRQLLLLLDGFDETTLQADAKRRSELLQRISPLLFGPTAAIMTTRPGYFVESAEYMEAVESRRSGGIEGTIDVNTPARRRLRAAMQHLSELTMPDDVRRIRDPHLATYDLGLLTSDQIDEYLATFTEELRSAAKTTPAAVRAYLDQVYDLGDLVTRPFILQMVVELVLARDIDVAGGVALTASDLYFLYTEQHLVRDVRKASSRSEVLTPEQRRRFAEECAIYMQRHDTLEIVEDKLGALAHKACGAAIIDEHGLDACLTDLRTTSLLTGAEFRTLRFIHRSFQEYFYASTVRAAILESSLRPMCDLLPPQILYFLGAYATTDDDFHQKLLELARNPGVSDPDRAAVAGNAASALLYSRERARDLRWHNVNVTHARRPNLSIDDSELTQFTVEMLDLESLSLNDTRIDGIVKLARRCDITMSGCSGSLDLSGNLGRVDISLCGPLSLTANEGVDSIVVDSSTVQLPVGHRSPPATISLTRSKALVGIVAGDGLVCDRSDVQVAPSDRARWSLECVGSTVRLSTTALACAAGHARRSVIVVTPSAADVPTHRMEGQEFALEGSVIAAGVTTVVPLAAGASDSMSVILGGAWGGDPTSGTFTGLRFQLDTRTDPKAPTDHVEAISVGPQGVLVRGRGASWQKLEEAVARVERIQLATPSEFASRVSETFVTALTSAGIDRAVIEAALAPARTAAGLWEA